MNLVGEKIDAFKIGQREFDLKETINAIRRTQKSMTWGSHAWQTINSEGFRFAVQGHLHKGHVYVALDWSDTFTIYFTNRLGKIKEIKKDIYIDVLIETIDKYVEYIPAYENR